MPANLPEESLDPADWDAMRRLGHRMVDDMIGWLQTVRDRPLWQRMPDEVRARFRVPLPTMPQAPEAVYEEFSRDVLPYPMGNVHPRFWGWVIGNGTPFGALAEFLAATMNPNCGGADHSAHRVEEQVLDWCKDMLGFPAEATGILVSGGSVANLLGLAVARHARAGFDVRRAGVRGAPGPLTVYASTETHSSVAKAVELMGLGTDALRLLPVDREYRLDTTALEAAVVRDRAAGAVPFCVVGNAGTVNTGATDDLDRLARFCRAEGLWLHVDGAFGALAALDPGLRPRLAGMERADSIAFDLHKWMCMPFEAGCVLIRDRQAHRDTFSVTPGYLARIDRGLAAGEDWPSDFGFQLSRGFRALKVWMSLKEHGVRRYARLIRQNVEQAGYLARLIQGAPDLELMAPAPLNIVCFRYTGGLADPGALDDLNREILMRLHESGIAAPTMARLEGRFCLRVANVNHRSRREDFDLLVREVRRLGASLTA